jgi:hypothetical protein
MGEEKRAGYFSVVTSSGRVLEALSKDEKLVPIVQVVQRLSNTAAGSSRSKRSITAFRSKRPRSKREQRDLHVSGILEWKPSDFPA